MNPFEKTAEEMKRQSEAPKRLAKGIITAGAAGAALGASSFAPMLARAAPFLSQYIPENLAIQGLSKISPQFGKFVKSAMNSGYDFGEIKNFIGEQITDSQKAQENRNIIEQESPELHQFISDEIKKGRKAIEAGAIAQHDKRFSDIIKKLMKSHKIPWYSLLESVYGAGETAQEPEQAQPQQQQAGQAQAAGQISPKMQSLLQAIRDARASR